MGKNDYYLYYATIRIVHGLVTNLGSNLIGVGS